MYSTYFLALNTSVSHRCKQHVSYSRMFNQKTYEHAVRKHKFGFGARRRDLLFAWHVNIVQLAHKAKKEGRQITTDRMHYHSKEPIPMQRGTCFDVILVICDDVYITIFPIKCHQVSF